MQDKCTICIECTIGSEIVGNVGPMEPLLMQDKCTICIECTIEIVGNVGPMEPLFFLFGDSVSVGTR
jgi:hypothetical protein